MKSKFVLIATAAVFVLSLSIAVLAGPRMTLASFEHSFGNVKAGTPLKYSFKIKNTGNEPLEIKNVSPSCGCTTSAFDKVIAPGAVGNVTLAIDKTESYRGEITKNATVTTNDPEHPNFVLTLRASFTE